MSKILIVEDEKDIAELEKDYLELSGFEVEIATDGTTGLSRGYPSADYLSRLALASTGTRQPTCGSTTSTSPSSYGSYGTTPGSTNFVSMLNTD